MDKGQPGTAKVQHAWCPKCLLNLILIPNDLDWCSFWYGADGDVNSCGQDMGMPAFDSGLVYKSPLYQISVEKISRQVISHCTLLCRNIRHWLEKLCKQAFISLVRSKLEYSATAWDPHLAQGINKIEMVQRRGACYVKQQFDYRSSVTDILNQLGWIPLVQRQREARLALMYKIIQGKVAIPVDDILTLADQRTCKKHPYNYRHLISNTEQYRNSYFPRSIPEWNLLAESTVCVDSTDAFRSRLRASP